MLIVQFSVGAHCYGIPCQHVVEVIPLVQTETIPYSASALRGSFVYRGLLTPLVDLSLLLGAASSPPLLSSRIIVVERLAESGQMERLGLLAARMTDVRRIANELDRDPMLTHVEFVGGVFLDSDGPIRILFPERLSPSRVATAAGGAAFPSAR